jgi:hypothetical protein
LADLAGVNGPVNAIASGAARGCDCFLLCRPGRQRQERAVGKFQIPAEHLHLTFPATLSLDHELGADRKPAGKTA